MLRRIEDSVGFRAAHDYSAVTPEFKGPIL
jgi:hypothetical protein